MPKGGQQRPCHHWKLKQKLHYFFFLILHFDIIHIDKKITRFYQQMSKFVDKNHSQCRTHHQKKLNQLKKNYPNQNQEETNLYLFYQEYYKIRMLDQDHLQYQITIFLQELYLNKHITLQGLTSYLNKMNQNLDILQLDKKYDFYKKVQMACQTESIRNDSNQNDRIDEEADSLMQDQRYELQSIGIFTPEEDKFLNGVSNLY